MTTSKTGHGDVLTAFQHAAIGYAQDPSQHTERRMNEARAALQAALSSASSGAGVLTLADFESAEAAAVTSAGVDRDAFVKALNERLAATQRAEPVAQSGVEGLPRVNLNDDGSVRRFFISPENGHVVETSRGPWVRYVDHVAALNAAPPAAVLPKPMHNECATMPNAERCKECRTTPAAEDWVTRKAAQLAVNHASLGVPRALAQATEMLDRNTRPAAPLSEVDWARPTTHTQRIADVMQALCAGKRPSDEIVTAWLSDPDDSRLQEFAIEHGPTWAQGIAVVDAARLLAEQPTEGVDHEFIAPSPSPQPTDEATDAARLEWVLPNLHPANFGMEFPGGYEWEDEADYLRKWRAAIDAEMRAARLATPPDNAAEGIAQ